ncbi:MAG: type II secretion system protein GspM [Bdellovibrionales bacterium]
MTSLSHPVRRLAALAILVILLWLAWNLILTPVAAFWQAHETRIANQVALLSRYEAALKAQEIISRQAAAGEAQFAGEQVLWPGGSPAVTAAALQTQIRQTIAGLGGTVRSTDDLPPVREGQLQRVGIHVDSEGDLTMAVGTLSAVEMARPMLFVSNLNMRTADIVQPHDKPTAINLSFDVYGYTPEGTP